MKLIRIFSAQKPPGILTYKNLGQTSIVSAYELGNDFIKVHFSNDNKILKYSYRTAGKAHVRMMKKLAEVGIGLGEYISDFMKEK